MKIDAVSLLFVTSLDGIAWDWINEKLYWSDPGQSEIEVYDPASGNRRRLIFTGDTSSPRGLAVDPTTRYIAGHESH